MFARSRGADDAYARCAPRTRGDRMNLQSKYFLFLVATAAMALPAQDDAAANKAKPDPEVAKKLEELKAVADDKKMEKDADGRTIIDDLLKKLDQAGMADKDKQAFAKMLERVLTAKLREPDKIELYIISVAALGRLGADGS